MTDQSSIISLRRKLEKEAWEIKSLGEIATEISKGKEVTKVQLGTGDYPAIRYSEIFKNKTNICECISRVNIEVIKNPKHCQHGDLLISDVSENKWGIGKAIVYLGNENPVIGNHVMSIKHKENPKFLLYLMSCEFIKKQTKDLAIESTVFGLCIKSVKKLKIPLPPRHIQDLIAESLDKWTEIEEQLEKELNRELEQRKKQYEYYKNFVFNNNQYFELKSLTDICELIRGYSFEASDLKEDGEIPVLQISHIQQHKIDMSEMTYLKDSSCLPKNSKRFIFRPEDICLAISGSRAGKIAINQTDNIFYFRSSVCKIHIIEPEAVGSRYLFYFLTTQELKIRELALGPAIKNVQLKELRKLKIPLPSLEEQGKIVEVLDKLRTNVENLQNEIPKLIHKIRKQYIFYKEQIMSTETVSSINTPTAKIAIKNSYIW